MKGDSFLNYYMNCHQKLKKQFGKATKCENKSCTYKHPKRYEWALRKGHQYSSNREDYIQLCPSCHRKYDYTTEQAEAHSIRMTGRVASLKQNEALNYGRTLTIKPVLQYSLAGELIKEWESITDASRSLGLLRSSISNCIYNRSKKSGGFIWKLKK